MESNPTNEEALFYAALEITSPDARAAYLDAACRDDAALRGRVEDLLQADERADDLLDAPVLGPELTLDSSTVVEGPGTVIGRYKLLEKIGEGGMAVVYMAEQKHPIRRRVALKLIKLGMDTRQVIGRFEAERQALAMMDHPNIAKVLDAGATDTGRPYFVMELVRGLPITQFCDRNNLTTRERLELFTAVCHAVQHAHQKGIIHRDLKPTNVLVTLHDGRPIPKVIDFGIAKAVNQQLTEKTVFTRYAQMIGTPEYMSPEQAEMSGLDVDTRTDVFSLGVLLYELLTGSPPFDAEYLLSKGYAELQRIIREEEPTRPSTKLSTLGEALAEIARQRRTSSDALCRLIRTDLDWIVMKTLEKDRTRRYETVSELAADIQRHLRNEPVLAGRPGTLYRIRKFVRRRRGVVAAVTTVVIAIAAGLIVSTGMYLRVKRSHEREAAALAESQTVVSFLTNDLLASVYPERTQGQQVTVRYVLQAASHNLDDKLANNPLAEAAIRMTLGLTYQKMGDYPAAKLHLERALEIREQALGHEHPDTLQCLCELAWLHIFQGRFDEAKEPALQALETGRRALGPEHPTVLSAMECCAFMYLIGFQGEKAEPLATEGYEISRRVLGEEHELTLRFMNKLAWIYDVQERRDAAREMAVSAYEISRRVLGREHPCTLQAMNQLGQVYRVEGRFEEAEALLHESVRLTRRVLGEEHLFTVWYMQRLASVYRAQKEYERMEEITAEALRIAGRIPGDLMVTGYLRYRLWQRVVALSADARAHYEAGEHDEALNLLIRQEKVRLPLEDGQTELLPPDVALMAMSLYQLGRREEAQEALDRLRAMLEGGEYTHEEQHLYRAEQLFAREDVRIREAWGLLEAGRLDEVSDGIEGLRTSSTQNPRIDPGRERSLVAALARAYCLRARRAEGRGAYGQAIADYEAAITTNPAYAHAHARLARLLAVCHLAQWRDGMRSIIHATRACELTQWSDPRFVSTLAAAHAEAGDYSRAAQLQRQAAELLGEDEREAILPNHARRLRLYEAGQPYRWGLVGWWTFDRSDGEVIPDSSGNGAHGRLVGDAHVTTDADRPGEVLSLDGDGDWVDVDGGAAIGTASEITVACWIKPVSNKWYETIACGDGNAWRLRRHLDSSTLEFGCAGIALPETRGGPVTGTIDVNDGRWHHVAGVYDGTAIYLYVDGQLDVSSEASGGIRGVSSRVLIGSDDVATSTFGRNRWFRGLIDDVRIYDYALPGAEIMALSGNGGGGGD